MRIFLVDFENVKSDGLRCVDCLNAEDKVITFFSKNAESMSMDTYFHLIHSKASFYAVRLDRTGSNALDFQLVSYLGYLMGTSEHQDVFVISKDHGFYSAVSFCRNFLIPQSKYHKTVTQYPSIASLFPNREDSRPVGMNAIPLFLHAEDIADGAKVSEAYAAPKELLAPEDLQASEDLLSQDTEVIAVKDDAEPENLREETMAVNENNAEKTAEQPPLSQPAAQEADANNDASSTEATQTVQPRRRESNRGRRESYRENRSNRTAREERPAPSVKHSDWDEISAAAEVGLPVIDLFAPVSQPKQETVSVKAEETAQPEEPVVPAAKPQPVEEPTAQPEENAALTGTEIDRMLEEFLEEAAAALESQTLEKPEFIEVASAEKAEEPIAVTAPAEEKTEAAPEAAEKPEEPAAPAEEKPKRERSNSRRKNTTRTRKNKSEQETTEKKEAAPAEPVVTEAPEPAQPAEPSAPAKKFGNAERELIKKVLNRTLELKDENPEQKEDLEKLSDCILNAAGKQDLYRMIIKLFGQKTGLAYYKVVKREYTNICNQIGKK